MFYLLTYLLTYLITYLLTSVHWGQLVKPAAATARSCEKWDCRRAPRRMVLGRNIAVSSFMGSGVVVPGKFKK